MPSRAAELFQGGRRVAVGRPAAMRDVKQDPIRNTRGTRTRETGKDRRLTSDNATNQGSRGWRGDDGDRCRREIGEFNLSARKKSSPSTQWMLPRLEGSSQSFPNIPLSGLPHVPLLDVARCDGRYGALRYIRWKVLESHDTPYDASFFPESNPNPNLLSTRHPVNPRVRISVQNWP